MISQHTLAQTVRTTGVGLHSGLRVDMSLQPAPANTGIVFRRVDLNPVVEIAANAYMIGDTRMASVLSHEGARVSTVEHLMSACVGLGIDNLYVDVTAEEIPILDGSSASFVYLLQSGGVQVQEAPRQFVRVLKPVEIRMGEGPTLKWAKLEPFHGFKLRFDIEFNHPAVNATGQSVEFDLSSGLYSRDIARARTFGFTRDVEAMRGQGLAMGGSLENAIVLDDMKVLNEGGLRYDDEFAKHKILDAMGDLYVLGKPLLAAYSAFRSGHALNNQLLRALLNDPSSFEVITFEDAEQAPAHFAELVPAY